MKKVLITTIIALFIFAAVQISVIAVNNNGTSHYPFEFGLYSGISRYASDTDSPLSSWACTGIFNRSADEDLGLQLIFNWSASAGIYCWDGNYRGSYDMRAEIMTFYRTGGSDFVGEVSESVGFYVQMEPPPENVKLEIEDCSSYGDIDGENQINGNARSSRSEIPF